MKLYYGERRPDGACLVSVFDEPERGVGLSNRRSLPMRLDLRNHSPTGFGWGYGGSGAAQLALALLCDALKDDHLAQDVYQEFKWAKISFLPDEWVITENEILDEVATLT